METEAFKLNKSNIKYKSVKIPHVVYSKPSKLYNNFEKQSKIEIVVHLKT